MDNLKDALEFLGVDPEERNPSTVAFEMAEALMGEYPDEDDQADRAAEIIGDVLLSVLRGER